MLGARAKTVSIITIFSVVTSWFGVFGAFRLMFIAGIVGALAYKTPPKSIKMSKNNFNFFFKIIPKSQISKM